MGAHPLLIIFLILVSAVVSIEVGLSVALLEIFAGVVAGNLFGDVTSPWMEFLANFGILGLMFFAGFETDEALLRKHFRSSLLIGVSSYVVPFVLVAVTALFVFNLPIRAALLVAIGLSTTSLALVYSVLADRDSINETWGQILLSSAMVVDVLSMLSLTIVFEGFRLSAVVVLVLVLVFIVSLSRVGRWVFSRYRVDRVEFKVRFVLLVLLGLELASESAHVHVALLAFVTGIVFSEMMEEHEALEDKLRSIVFGFMSPLFFFKAGSTLKLGSLDGQTLVMILVFGALAFGAKYLATYFSVRAVLPRPLARFSALVFNFRLTFGIIVATFGLSEGLIGDTLYTALLGTVLGTLVVASVLIRVLPDEM